MGGEHSQIRLLFIFSHEFLMEFFEFTQHIFEFVHLGEDRCSEMICAWFLTKSAASNDANAWEERKVN